MEKLDMSDWLLDAPSPEEWPGGVLRGLDLSLASLDSRTHNK